MYKLINCSAKITNLAHFKFQKKMLIFIQAEQKKYGVCGFQCEGEEIMKRYKYTYYDCLESSSQMNM